MILDDHVDVVLRAMLRQLPQPVGGQLHLLVIRFRLAVCVDANRMTTEEARGFDPLDVVVHGFAPLRRVHIAQIALAVDHNEQAAYAFTSGPLFHFIQIRAIRGFVGKELVDVLHCIDAEVTLRRACEVQMIERFRANRPVQRPLRKRDFEQFAREGKEINRWQEFSYYLPGKEVVIRVKGSNGQTIGYILRAVIEK